MAHLPCQSSKGTKEVTLTKEPISVAYNIGDKGRVDCTHKWLTFVWDEV